jgi:hypothetical protein
VTQPPTTTEETPPVVDKKTAEPTAGESTTGVVPEVTQEPEEGSQAPAADSDHKDASSEAAQGVPTVVTPSTDLVATVAPSEISASPVQEQSPSALSSQEASSAHRAAQVRSELAAFGASITASDAGGWLGASSAASVATVPLIAAEEASKAIATGASAGGQGGGSVVGEHPSAPIPGSGSGGAGGGSAAAGGSGPASSASFTLVGVLLQSAPRAMRRLLLAQPSWRTSFFVLIPERPD